MASSVVTMSAAPNAEINISSAASNATKTPDVKPCCVCKEEKTARDNCMLFSRAANPEADCVTMIDKYKSCMAGYGFRLP
ncbi:BgTH12-01103 [Blumeria graminis f. sp. triticale]|uniref:BgTH12-01103 n=2 Tax=Blumeria graminis TaxID=34373 RepID=A0A9W4GI63_BLUGR|nr:BgTH12-01103 [Blumeria graminis f. sp. triticale]